MRGRFGILILEMLAIVLGLGVAVLTPDGEDFKVDYGIFGFAVSFSWLMFTRQKGEDGTPRTPIRCTLLAAVTGLIAFAAAWLGTSYMDQTRDEAALAAQFPVFKTLKNKDPAAYDQYIKIAHRFARKEIDADAAENQVSALIIAIMNKKLPLVSDDLLIRSVRNDINFATDLEKTAPEKCVAVMLAQPRGSTKGLISQEHLDEELKTVNDVILAEPVSNPNIASDADAEVMAANVVKKVSSTQNISLSQLGDLLQGKGDPGTSCKVLISYTNEFLSLPGSQAAALLREGMASP